MDGLKANRPAATITVIEARTMLYLIGKLILYDIYEKVYG